LLSCLAIALAFGLNKILSPKTFLTPFLLTSYETGMIGFALYTQIFGLSNLGNIAMIYLRHAPFMFIVFKTLIDNSRRHTPKAVIKDMLSPPYMVYFPRHPDGRNRLRQNDRGIAVGRCL